MDYKEEIVKLLEFINDAEKLRWLYMIAEAMTK